MNTLFANIFNYFNTQEPKVKLVQITYREMTDADLIVTIIEGNPHRGEDMSRCNLQLHTGKSIRIVCEESISHRDLYTNDKQPLYKIMFPEELECWAKEEHFNNYFLGRYGCKTDRFYRPPRPNRTKTDLTIDVQKVSTIELMEKTITDRCLAEKDNLMNWHGYNYIPDLLY